MLALDYDGTLATNGSVIPETVAALEALVASGRKLVLATGRQLPDLLRIFPDVSLFSCVIAENGAVIYDTVGGNSEVVGEPPPEDFVRALEAEGIDPLAQGRVVVATTSRHAMTLQALIKSMKLSHAVILNKDSAMVLPEGVNKGSSLQLVLNRLGIRREEVICAGDGENDADLFRVSGFRVAVANAVPVLKETADWITPADAGSGIQQLTELLLNNAARKRSDSGAPQHGIHRIQ